MKKRLSLLLCIVMVLAMIVPAAAAADTAQPAVQDGPDVAQAEQNPDAIAPEN